MIRDSSSITLSFGIDRILNLKDRCDKRNRRGEGIPIVKRAYGNQMEEMGEGRDSPMTTNSNCRIICECDEKMRHDNIKDNETSDNSHIATLQQRSHLCSNSRMTSPMLIKEEKYQCGFCNNNNPAVTKESSNIDSKSPLCESHNVNLKGSQDALTQTHTDNNNNNDDTKSNDYTKTPSAFRDVRLLKKNVISVDSTTLTHKAHSSTMLSLLQPINISPQRLPPFQIPNDGFVLPAHSPNLSTSRLVLNYPRLTTRDCLIPAAAFGSLIGSFHGHSIPRGDYRKDSSLSILSSRPNLPSVIPGLSTDVHPSEWKDSHTMSGRSNHPSCNVRCQVKRKKPRTSFTRLQIMELEKRFHRQKYLASNERSSLAKGLKMTDAQVKTWFQNRRTKWRRQTAEERDAERQAATRLMLTLYTEPCKTMVGQSQDLLCLGNSSLNALQNMQPWSDDEDERDDDFEQQR